MKPRLYLILFSVLVLWATGRTPVQADRLADRNRVGVYSPASRLVSPEQSLGPGKNLNIRSEVNRGIDGEVNSSIIASTIFTLVQTIDPVIQTMIDLVDSSVVYSYTGNLSGEWPVWVDGSYYTLTTRYTYSGEPVEKATSFVGEHLENLGLEVEYHSWSDNLPPNVIGQLTGASDPEDVFIICAHLDDMPPDSVAPGADDNASGSAAVLLAADILTWYQWDCTLRFALWTGEEQGLLGSKVYAGRVNTEGENILGVINLDMVGWDGYGEPDIDLHASQNLAPDSLLLANLYASVVEVYDMDLVPHILSNGVSASDHSSFWNYGYPAILAIEYYSGGDFNPYYHSTNDRLENLNLPYMTEMVKASVGSMAHMSNCIRRDNLGVLNGRVTDASTGGFLPGVDIAIAPAGRQAISIETGAGGFYTATVPAGEYELEASMPGYLSIITTATVVTGQVATRDFSLTPVPILDYYPDQITASVPFNRAVTQTLWISNTGPANLSFTIQEQMGRVKAGTAGEEVGWLVVAPSEGVVNPGKSLPVQVTMDAAGLDAGEHQAWLQISSNDPIMPGAAINISLVVEPCVQVRSITLTMVTSGTIYTGDTAAFQADLTPDWAEPPFTYRLNIGSVEVDEGTSWIEPVGLTATLTASGYVPVQIMVWNCSMVEPVAATTWTTVTRQEWWLYFPLILRNIYSSSPGGPEAR
ncbi:MAG: M28 family peptidase [Anaerolineales bacterium]|nr:M28 family peptidase [Anaerolineales bacterium]